MSLTGSIGCHPRADGPIRARQKPLHRGVLVPTTDSNFERGPADEFRERPIDNALVSKLGATAAAEPWSIPLHEQQPSGTEAISKPSGQ